MATLLLTSCTTKNVTSSTSPTTSTQVLKPVVGDAYALYKEANENIQKVNNYTVAVNSTYTMSYSDDTKDMFIMDGVLEYADEKAHLTQNIESNGGNFNIEGYYYNGNLYNKYNNITYYEDMDYSDVEKTMLVPLKPYLYPKDMIDSIQAKQDADENTIYTIFLNNQEAKDLFTDRYDTYGLNQYDDYTVKSNQIEVTFDSNNHCISEKTTFDTSVSYSGEVVDVTFNSSVNYLKLDETEVKISKSLKKEQKQYVYYEDIDTSSLDTDTQYDDTEEDTVTDTFKKRLINRLGYEINEDGEYQVSYNDNEAYVIDFKNYTFTYANYSIRYVYNWKGNVGTMGSCNYTFSDEKSSSSCEESTVDMIKKVETYFEMELYYCGLSLSDLQKEAK